MCYKQRAILLKEYCIPLQGDLVVEADPEKSKVFKDMILRGIRRFSNLIRTAIIPQTLTKELKEQGEEQDYGDWGDEASASAGDRATSNWLPTCLRYF